MSASADYGIGMLLSVGITNQVKDNPEILDTLKCYLEGICNITDIVEYELTNCGENEYLTFYTYLDNRTLDIIFNKLTRKFYRYVRAVYVHLDNYEASKITNVYEYSVLFQPIIRITVDKDKLNRYFTEKGN